MSSTDLVAVILAAIFVTLLLAVLTWFYTKERDRLTSLIDSLRTDHREERMAWERERERLLNRAMTREWTSYVQMQGAMQSSNSTSDPYVGMSDEEELRRAGLTDAEGYGEVIVDITEEAKAFGIV